MFLWNLYNMHLHGIYQCFIFKDICKGKKFQHFKKDTLSLCILAWMYFLLRLVFIFYDCVSMATYRLR